MNNGESSISITRLLNDWSAGRDQALAELMPLVYDELRRIARRHLRSERTNHTLEGTGLVHEAFLRLSKQRVVNWQSRSQLFGVASRLMRRILVDHARARLAAKRGSGLALISLDEMCASQIDVGSDPNDADWLDGSYEKSIESAADLVALDQALSRLEQLDPEQCRIVELRYFGGLSVEETARELGVSVSTVKRDWATARAWLARELRQ